MSLPVVDNEKGVFVAISDIELKKESMQEFKLWFARSNEEVSKFEGFISRQLLESPDGTHKILVMFSSKELFAKMRESPTHAAVHREGTKLMARPPRPTFYSVISG